jgi:hypothetical protein
VSSSWFGLGLFGLRQEDRQKKRDYAPLRATFPDGSQVSLAELSFAFGRSDVAVNNALAALCVGAWGALVFVVVYAIPSFTATTEGLNFPYLAALQRVISVGGYWLVAAFFFGYFFDQIRGAAGWKKGAILAIGILLATEPLSLLQATSVADYSAIAIRVFQTLAFFMLLGLIAFDLYAFRTAIRQNIAWRALPLLAGLSVVEAMMSVVLAGAGVAISTALSGQLTEVLGQVAGELIQTPMQSQGLPP